MLRLLKALYDAGITMIPGRITSLVRCCTMNLNFMCKRVFQRRKS